MNAANESVPERSWNLLQNRFLHDTALLILFIGFGFFAHPLHAQTGASDYTDPAPLFASDEPLELTIESDFRKLVRNKEDEPVYLPGKLVLRNSGTDGESFDIEVRARGYSRRVYDFCTFPPLKLDFKKKATTGTVFEGQNKIKLVTFCKDVNKYENYVLQEYLIYKTYNIITDTSFQVRLARITYRDSERDKEVASRFGFLIEDIDDLAERFGGKEIDKLLPNHDMCYRPILDKFTVFQYMIGNVDWWIASPKLHNVKLITTNSGAPIPIPYDFDYSGAINTTYSAPPDELPINSVRERLFRGYCRLPGEYEDIFQVFKNKKKEIYSLYRDIPWLDERSKKMTLNYFDKFYEEIEDPKAIKKNFYDACPVRHEHLHEMSIK